jgi:hypothetical protein
VYIKLKSSFHFIGKSLFAVKVQKNKDSAKKFGKLFSKKVSKDALKLHGINRQFNEASLLELVGFYNLYRDEFDKWDLLYANEANRYVFLAGWFFDGYC